MKAHLPTKPSSKPSARQESMRPSAAPQQRWGDSSSARNESMRPSVPPQQRWAESLARHESMRPSISSHSSARNQSVRPSLAPPQRWAGEARHESMRPSLAPNRSGDSSGQRHESIRPSLAPGQGSRESTARHQSVRLSAVPHSPDMSPMRPSAFKYGRVRRRRTTKRNDRKTMTGSASEDSMNAYRISVEDVIPSHYTMCIKPSMEELTFEGCVSVNLKIMKETSVITLHVLDLTITKITWEEDVTEKKQKPMKFDIDTEKEMLHITFEPAIPPSEGCIRINFNGIINNKMIGLYRSSLNSLNQTEQLGTHLEQDPATGQLVASAASLATLGAQEFYHILTNFEPTFARMCFPCWDEPSVKCTFDLTFIVPKNVTVISNMPVKITYAHRSKPHLHVVEFMRTPLISTYMVAFAIGQFDCLEMKSLPSKDPAMLMEKINSLFERRSSSKSSRHSRSRGSQSNEFDEVDDEEAESCEPPATVTCRVYTAPGKSEMGRLALEILVKLVQRYQTYFKCPFPLPKLDLVAVSEHLTGGGESWGLLMLKDSHILLNKEEHSKNSSRVVSLLIANQLVHQWFGGLVTLDWWSYQWFTEGISMFMEYLAIDHHDPSDDIWVTYYTETFLHALAYDGLRQSHVLEMLIFHPNEINENFDRVALDKGVSLLSMLKHYVGTAAFRKSLCLFLQKFKYKNANTNDLWRCFELVSGKPIGAIMQTWTRKQLGYPLVRVTAIRRDENAQVLTLTQEKFWADPLERERAGRKEYIWSIPLTFSTGNSPATVVKEVLMERKTIRVVIPHVSKSQWVKLNPGGVGFYRVHYLPEMVLQFHRCIRDRSLPPVDRVGMLNDVFAFAQAGLTSILELFNLLEAYVEEDTYIVWTEIIATLDKLDRLMWDTEFYQKFRSYYCVTLNAILEKVGWYRSDSEDSAMKKLRALILSRMVLAHHEETLIAAEQRFAGHYSGHEIVPVELRSVVYQGALIKGVPADILRLLLKRYKETESMEERECIIHSFTAISDADLLHDILEFAKSPTMRHSETIHIIRTIANTKSGRDVAWSFFRGYNHLFKLWCGQGLAYTKLVQAVTENYTTHAKGLEIYEFFKDKFATTPGLERTVLQIEEKIHINETWLQRESDMIEDYLSTYE